MVYIKTIFLAFLGIAISSPSCEIEKNFCSECHPITNLCTKCKYNTLIPDEEGGCTGVKKCIVGKNYCNKCKEENNLCNECEAGYYPDKNGGCSYDENCEISYGGHCIKCQENYYLIGEELKICKYIDLDDFQNCKEINYKNGQCSICEDNYFLNSGDKKCSSYEHCYESAFGICTYCEENYILNKQKDSCEEKSEEFLNCKITIDGKQCDECIDGFYFSDDGKCVKTNHCLKSNNDECTECKEGYYLTNDKLTCTNDNNCLIGDEENGLCNWCIDNYYLEKKDRNCKSNLEIEELNHCKIAENGICSTCEKYYYLGEDSKCSISQNCAESEKELCIVCSDGFYLGKDGKCTNVKDCIYSRNNECIECDGNLYFDRIDKVCKEGIDNFLNCKYNSEFEQTKCAMCKDDFYLKLSDSLCYSNKEEGPFYKCQISNFNGDKCSQCVGEYYIGRDDLKCNLIEGCLSSENEKKCLECDRYYCLDNEGNCVDNYYITDEEKAFYYYCKVLNDKGDGCQICENGLNATDAGICYDDIHCEKNENGVCTKCQSENPYGYFSYCLNEVYGCVDTFLKHCIRCDNILELDYCTECEDGYEIDEYGDCVQS